MIYLEEESATAYQFQTQVENLQTVNQQLMDTIDLQQEQLTKIQSHLTRCLLDLQSCRMRIKLAETKSQKVLAKASKPPKKKAPHPDR